tara:strand:- start:48 stop:317 length:270 start_codon:yes stop_codon:yes gene_type:complete
MQEENETLREIVSPDSEVKKWLVEYVGEKNQPEDNQVTVEMVVETVADEFPDFLAAVAEENWVRGYQQAINDIAETEKEINQHMTESNE